jgi:hypothetical protein
MIEPSKLNDLTTKEISILKKHYTPSFIGISNWDIDASKLNRNVYLARPDLTLDDLKTTSETIIKYTNKDYNLNADKKNEIKNLADVISEAYRDFRIEQRVCAFLI